MNRTLPRNLQGKNFNIIQALFFLKAIGFPIKVNTFALEKMISIIGEASAPTQFKQGKNFNIIQALFFVITGDVVLKSRSSRSRS